MSDTEMSDVVGGIEQSEHKAFENLKSNLGKKSADDITRPNAALWDMWLKHKTHDQQMDLVKDWIQKIPTLPTADQPAKQRLITRIKTHMDSNNANYGGGKWVGDKWKKPMQHLKVPGAQQAYQGVSNLYDDRYLFDDSDGVQMIDYQRDDASYGEGTNRDFIWNPRLNDYGRSKVFGYEGRTTSSIDYMLLSVTFVVFMAICCCLVVAVSFVSGYITKSWFSKKKKTQSDYDRISVSNV